MRLTKLGHSCVRLEKDGAALVIDPGVWSGDDVLSGADAILITHEHADHLDSGVVTSALTADPSLEVWTNPSAAAQLAEYGARVHTVGHGDSFKVKGFEVGVYGELHAVIHPDLPTIPNIGFAIDGLVFHPGDSFTVPEEQVHTLLLPVAAPWLKVAEVIDYARAVSPERGIAIHDAIANANGLGLVQNLLRQFALPNEGGYTRLEPGTGVEI